MEGETFNTIVTEYSTEAISFSGAGGIILPYSSGHTHTRTQQQQSTRLLQRLSSWSASNHEDFFLLFLSPPAVAVELCCRRAMWCVECRCCCRRADEAIGTTAFNVDVIGVIVDIGSSGIQMIQVAIIIILVVVLVGRHPSIDQTPDRNKRWTVLQVGKAATRLRIECSVACFSARSWPRLIRTCRSISAA